MELDAGGLLHGLALLGGKLLVEGGDLVLDVILVQAAVSILVD